MIQSNKQILSQWALATIFLQGKSPTASFIKKRFEKSQSFGKILTFSLKFFVRELALFRTFFKNHMIQ